MPVISVPGHGLINQAAWLHDAAGIAMLHLAIAIQRYSPRTCFQTCRRALAGKTIELAIPGCRGGRSAQNCLTGRLRSYRRSADFVRATVHDRAPSGRAISGLPSR